MSASVEKIEGADQSVDSSIDLAFLFSVDEKTTFPVRLPYSIISAFDSMTEGQCKSQLYISRQILGFSGRDAKILSYDAISKGTGCARSTVAESINHLQSSTDKYGELKHQFLKAIDRGVRMSKEFRLVFPSCSPESQRAMSAAEIQSDLFSVPTSFFDGYVNDNGDYVTPLKDWCLNHILMYLRLCALHAQSCYDWINLKDDMCLAPFKANKIILPSIKKQFGKMTSTIKMMHELNLIELEERSGRDPYMFKIIEPPVRDFSNEKSNSNSDSGIVDSNSGTDIPISDSGIDSSKSGTVDSKSGTEKSDSGTADSDSGPLDSVVVVPSLKKTTNRNLIPVDDFVTIRFEETGHEIKISLITVVEYLVDNYDQSKITGSAVQLGRRLMNIARNQGVTSGSIDGKGLDIKSFIDSQALSIQSEAVEGVGLEIHSILKSGELAKTTTESGSVRYIKAISTEWAKVSKEPGDDASKIYGTDFIDYLLAIETVESYHHKKADSLDGVLEKAISEKKLITLIHPNPNKIDYTIVEVSGTSYKCETQNGPDHIDYGKIIINMGPQSVMGGGYTLKISRKKVTL